MDKLIFRPVVVDGGRKYRGFAYDLGYDAQISRSTWAYTSFSVKLWEPVSKTYVYANPDYVCACATPTRDVEADKQDYVKSVIDGTIAWCRSTKSGAPEAEIIQFARNTLYKHHPEMHEAIDAKLADQRDVVAEINRTLDWARNLKSRPAIMYGRACPGGKPYSKARQMRIAKESLERRGITKLEGFAEAWEMILTIQGLLKYL